MDMVLNDMVKQAGDDLFEEPKYIKLPSSLEKIIYDGVTHARRRGEDVPTNEEISKFFD